MSSRVDTDLVIRDALLLRGFALSILARQTPADALVAHARAASDVAWTVFLVAETCAAPLARALRQRSDSALLPQRVRDLIARAELPEQQRIMTGRWQLDRIDALAAARGRRAIVIKGGTLLRDEGRAVDLSDLDFLVSASDVPAFRDLLQGLGMREEAGWPDPESGHLCPFRGPDLLPVELRLSLNYGPAWTTIAVASRPMPGYAALWRWTGPEAALGAVLHLVEMHPHRTGHLRDLFVIADVLAELDGEGRALFDRRVAALPARATILEVVQLADAVQQGRMPVDTARLQTVAAMKYSDVCAPPNRLTTRFFRSRSWGRYQPVLLAPAAVAASVVRQLGSGYRSAPWRPLGLGVDSRANRVVGGAGTALRRAMRLAITLAEGTLARRAARRAVEEADKWLRGSAP